MEIKGIECYSCGSLFRRRDSPGPTCNKFNPLDPTQKVRCKPDEACLLYRWKKSSTEFGKNYHLHNAVFNSC